MFQKIILIALILLIAAGIVWYIRQTADDSTIAELRAIPESDRIPELIEAIMKQGPRTVPALIEVLQAPSDERLTTNNVPRQNKGRLWQTNAAIIDLLAEWRAEEALDALESMVRVPRGYGARELPISHGATAIGKIGGERSFTILEQILRDSTAIADYFTRIQRTAAIAGLGFCDDPRAIPVLQEELVNRENSQRMRMYAAVGLAMLGNRDGLETALEGIATREIEIIRLAIVTVGYIGDPSLLPLLEQTRQRSVTRLTVPVQTAVAQIEAAQLSGAEQTAYIARQLLASPDNTTLVDWGTSTLKTLNTQAAKDALAQLAEGSGSDKELLRRTALRKLHTIQ